MKYFILIISCLLSQIAFGQNTKNAEQTKNPTQKLQKKTAGIYCGSCFSTRPVSYFIDGIKVSEETFNETRNTRNYFKDYEKQMAPSSRIETIDAKKPRVSLYPNPASLTLNILSEEFAYDRFGLYSMSGVLISKGELNRDLEISTIDVSNLVPGNYFLIASGPDGQSSIRFSKQ